MLDPEEGVAIDHDRMGDLFTQLGPTMADSVLSRSIEEVSIRICKVEAAYRKDDIAAVGRLARGLVAIADQIGMTTLARVANDVSTCAHRGEPNALAATVARLGRIGDRSLTAVWDLQGMTI